MSQHDAEYFRNWRAKIKLLGEPPPTSGKHKTPRKGDRHRPGYKRPPGKKRPYIDKFQRAKFCAWDGEGIGKPRNRYVMLSNSNRDCLRGENLGSHEIIEYLLDHRGTSNTVHCVYGAVYDFTHWFLDLPDDLKRELHEKGRCVWRPLIKGKKRKRHTYIVRYTARKSFSVDDRTRWDKKSIWDSERDYKKRNRRHLRKIEVWDVIGFFQQSFVSSLDKWQIGTREEVQHIADMKKNRGTFTPDKEAEILEYNFLECELLKALMEKLHSLLLTNPMPEQMTDADDGKPKRSWLRLKRWDGAGAVAAAMFTREGIRPHLGSSTAYTFGDKPTDDWHYRSKIEQAEIEYALRSAYFGGRIECFKRGRANAPGFDLDIKSAYPAAMLTMPSFQKGGRWYWTYEFDRRVFGVWQVSWECETQGHPVCPFPYRMHTGSVIFPAEGAGWYHTSEVAAALDDPRNHLKIRGGYFWKPSTNYKPFSFVQRYFDARVYLQSIKHPAEKILKLGLNSLYGKTAQTLGSYLEEWDCRLLELPDQHRTDDYVGDCELDKIFEKTAGFYNLAWAGAITAHCRSTIYREAIKHEQNVAMIQTDGLFVTVPPGESMPHIRQENKLGGFEVVKYDDSCIVQAGVYYLGTRHRDGSITWGVDEKAKKTRGFSADDVAVDEILQAWKKADLFRLEYTSTPRFQTLGFAINKNDFGELAKWQEQTRHLNLWFDSKRSSVEEFSENHQWNKSAIRRKCKELHLHERQLPTYNLLNTDYLAGCPSRPCNPKWREKLHSEGEDDAALTEPEIEGDDFTDNFKADILAKYGF